MPAVQTAPIPSLSAANLSDTDLSAANFSDTNSSTNNSCQIPCFYVNATSKTQIIRVNHCDHVILEKVIFPGCTIRFEAWLEDQLEISTYECITTIVADTIPCQQLSIT
ncbi:MAG: DUF1830 domain-containing protein [Leptolyngbyaceae bacterium]|nr:DUF1830 domain-containing protein [Leptolyngbyaceae bacterium]